MTISNLAAGSHWIMMCWMGAMCWCPATSTASRSSTAATTSTRTPPMSGRSPRPSMSPPRKARPATRSSARSMWSRAPMVSTTSPSMSSGTSTPTTMTRLPISSSRWRRRASTGTTPRSTVRWRMNIEPIRKIFWTKHGTVIMRAILSRSLSSREAANPIRSISTAGALSRVLIRLIPISSNPATVSTPPPSRWRSLRLPAPTTMSSTMTSTMWTTRCLWSWPAAMCPARCSTSATPPSTWASSPPAGRDPLT